MQLLYFSLITVCDIYNTKMELNCEISNPQPHIFDKLYCHKSTYEHNVCPSDEFEEKTCTAVDAKNNKLFNLLSTIMKANTHHLEMFKLKHFPVSYNCRAENAIKIFFGWSVGVNIKELCEYLDINEDVAKHFYLLSTLYARKYIKNHIEEWKVGGPGVVVLLDIYPGGCNKFNYTTTNDHNSILCVAEIKDIPTRYWFQILTQTEIDKSNEEILNSVQSIIRPNSTLVIDLESTRISEETYQKIKDLYRTVVSLESLKRHNTVNQSLLDNLETIWKPALDICEFGNYHTDVASYYTSFLWNQRFGNDNLTALLNQF